MTARNNAFTAEGIRAVTEQRDAKRLVGQAVKVWQSAETMRGTATATAAMATHAAQQSGYLGSGKTLATGQIDGKTYADMFGVAQSTVTLWRTLGIALVVVGVPSDSDLFRHLAFRGAAGQKPVADAIRADGATVESVESMVREFVRPDGTAIKPADRKPKFRGKPSKKPSKGSDPTPVEVTGTPVQKITAVVTLLDTLLKQGGLTIDQWQTIDGRLGKIRDRENTLHAKQAATPAKRTPAKRTTRKAS